MAIAGVIFGIISVIAYFGLPGIITSLIGLFLTYRARGEAASNQKLVKIGFVLNGIFLIMGLYFQFRGGNKNSQ
jgi:4-hydroxybenzoate polyprenyltransferase